MAEGGTVLCGACCGAVQGVVEELAGEVEV